MVPLTKLRKEQFDVSKIFEPLVGNGLLHKLAALDYLLGQTDRHAGNVLSNKYGHFKLIDAGSTFAGKDFDPANDPKSFIPIYLRCFSPRDFRVLTPEERFQIFPKPSNKGDAALTYWLDSIPEGQIVHLLHCYGIQSQPVVDRLNKLKSYVGLKSEFLNKFYAGMPV